MIKSLVLAAVTTAGALGASSANAGVSWSVNVNTPVVGTVVSGGPAYYGHGHYRPGYGRVYGPAPVYAAPPVAYYPAPVYYRPAPVVVYPRYYPGWRHGRGYGYGHGHGHWEGHGRR